MDVFPAAKHPDYDVALTELKATYDLCSQIAHGSILGLASHFDQPSVPLLKGARTTMNFFDIPSDQDFTSALFQNFLTHLRMCEVFGRILRPYANDKISGWDVRLDSVKTKFWAHFQKHAPPIKS